MTDIDIKGGREGGREGLPKFCITKSAAAIYGAAVAKPL